MKWVPNNPLKTFDKKKSREMGRWEGDKKPKEKLKLLISF